ncbi:hypothetical protein TNCV_1960371 [Trichonephila clavipes]|nr:hypothetical protein TNCV_1960371 [Trichonephila clavipes]
MVLKANDRRTSCPCHDEFRGPRSDYVRQVALATTKNSDRLLIKEIGSRVGRNQTTVMRICDRWMQEGTTDRLGRSHQPQCTTSREDR